MGALVVGASVVVVTGADEDGVVVKDEDVVSYEVVVKLSVVILTSFGQSHEHSFDTADRSDGGYCANEIVVKIDKRYHNLIISKNKFKDHTFYVKPPIRRDEILYIMIQIYREKPARSSIYFMLYIS